MENMGPFAEKLGHFRMGDQIEPPFAVAEFLVGEAAMFVSKGKEGFA